MYKITEIVNDTIPSYSNDDLTERYNETSLKNKNLTLKENDTVFKKYEITEN